MKKFLSLLTLGMMVLGVTSHVNAAVIYINFTNAATVAAPGGSGDLGFNTLNNATATLFPLNTNTGTSSGISIQNTAAPSGGNSTGATAITGDAATAGITLTAGSTYHFTNDNVVATYSFSGLTPSTVNYTFTVFGSRNVTDTRTTKYTLTNGITPASLNLDVSSASGPNNSNVVVFSPIKSSAGGTLTFSFQDDMTSGNQFGYLNAIRIDTAPVPEPTSLALLGLTGAALLGFRRRRPAS